MGRKGSRKTSRKQSKKSSRKTSRKTSKKKSKKMLGGKNPYYINSLGDRDKQNELNNFKRIVINFF